MSCEDIVYVIHIISNKEKWASNKNKYPKISEKETREGKDKIVT